MTNTPESRFVLLDSTLPERPDQVNAVEALDRGDLFEIPLSLCQAAGFLGELKIRVSKDIFLRLTKTETTVSTAQLNEKSLSDLTKFLKKLNLTIKENEGASTITFDYLFDSQKCVCTASIDSSHDLAIHVEIKEDQQE
jgi:hypothetical protein